MISKISIRAAALLAAVSLTAAACGGSSSGGPILGPGFDLASSKILNPSTHTGGTIKLVSSSIGGFDSLDPGDTSESATWDLFRTFGRTVLGFAHKPGLAGDELQGDLADGVGTPSADGLTWTYKLRSGATFEDGTAITAKDIAWAIERSNWSTVHTNAPSYFINLLTPSDDARTKQFSTWDVYKKGPLPGGVIDYTDPAKLVFHLPRPFGEFNYLMTLPATMPVPFERDVKDPTGYANHPIASGAYKIASYTAGTDLKLVRNTNYNTNSDPLGEHPAYADGYDVQLGLAAADRDQRLLDNTVDADIDGPLTVATHQQVLIDPTLKSQVDDSSDSSLVYAALNVNVIPDINCRKAIEYGTNKQTVLNEFGGKYGGQIATSMLPPSIPGHVAFDDYPNVPDEAIRALSKCRAAGAKGFDAQGHFHTTIVAQTNNPDLDNAAVAMQTSLQNVGIVADIVLYPFAQYSSSFAGETLFANTHGLGIILTTWIPDWPSGYGFMDQIITKDGISLPGVGGGSNYAQFDDPGVDQLIESALATSDTSRQRQIWGDVDQKVMAQAVEVPLVNRNVMRFRSSKLTNVMIGAYGAYDLSVLGKS